jgi:hypothetical protein
MERRLLLHGDHHHRRGDPHHGLAITVSHGRSSLLFSSHLGLLLLMPLIVSSFML